MNANIYLHYIIIRNNNNIILQNEISVMAINHRGDSNRVVFVERNCSFFFLSKCPNVSVFFAENGPQFDK